MNDSPAAVFERAACILIDSYAPFSAARLSLVLHGTVTKDVIWSGSQGGANGGRVQKVSVETAIACHWPGAVCQAASVAKLIHY